VNRSRLGYVVLAVCCVLALSLAAATLDSASAGSGVGFGSGDGVGTGGGDGGSPAGAQESPLLDFPPWLALLLQLAFFVLFVVALYEFYRRYGLRGVAGMLAISVVAALLILFVDFSGLVPDLGGNATGPSPDQPAPPGGGGGGASGESAEGVSVPVPTAMLALAFAGLLVVAIVVARSGSDASATPSDPPTESRPENEEVRAVGDAAGRAADDIAADADAENAVYRAWQEMAAALDVPNPESSTPQEFADAAVAAGMAEGDVAELTGLFEEVRYGGADPETRADRAEAALRRIESTYGGEP
jgi:hypothetical protein